MNKTEFVEKICAGSPCNKKETKEIVDLVFKELSAVLAAGDGLTLPGFGTFKAVKRAAREGRNPRTGETLTIPASTTVKFTPGVTLKEMVNGGK